MAVTSQQIAELAGVSRGTVDRALHHRGRVNPEVAARIFKIAAELGYQPPRANKDRRTLRLGMIFQSAETPMIQMAASGARQAARKLQYHGVQVELREVHGRDTAQVFRQIEELLEWQIDGLAIASDNSPELTRRISMLYHQGISVVTFNTDCPGSHRLCFIGMDNYRAGQTAAGLVRQMLPSGGLVLPIAGHVNHEAHQRRMQGFLDEIKSKNRDDIQLLPIQFCFDRDDYAYEITLHILQKHPSVACVYITSNGQAGVCRAIEEAGRKERVRVIAYDLTEMNRQLLYREKLSFVLDQMAYEQGSRPLQVLYNYLCGSIPPEKDLQYTEILIYTKYNIGDTPRLCPSDT